MACATLQTRWRSADYKVGQRIGHNRHCRRGSILTALFVTKLKNSKSHEQIFIAVCFKLTWDYK